MTEMAMDATGLARTTVSDYFCSRRGRKFRRWVKVAVVVVAGSLLPAALAVDLKPTHDCVQARSLPAQAALVAQPQRLYADGTAGGQWRGQMTPEYLSRLIITDAGRSKASSVHSSAPWVRI